jgi:hypothetical protein
LKKAANIAALKSRTNEGRQSHAQAGDGHREIEGKDLNSRNDEAGFRIIAGKPARWVSRSSTNESPRDVLGILLPVTFDISISEMSPFFSILSRRRNSVAAFLSYSLSRLPPLGG